MTGVATATSIASGATHTCARLSNQSVQCWGANGYGQLGNGTSGSIQTRAVSVVGVTATAVTAGETHTCALTSGGLVVCWGGNGLGQIGNGTLTTRQLTPTRPLGL